jgi:hypothetical protein
VIEYVTDLTNDQVAIVNSYLSAKYGINKYQAVETSYNNLILYNHYSSGHTTGASDVVWDITSNADYAIN